MKTPICVLSLENFDAAFGELGLKVGPRTGPNKRTKDQKEWYVVRRFLREAISARIFLLPLTICKGSPPEPDFVTEYFRGRALIEITEATDEADQREMTRQELCDTAILLGELGGRFKGGGGEPGHLWASDIVDAVERKAGKSIFSTRSSNRHLIIYPNSNASSLISNDDEERRAFSLLLSVTDGERKKLTQMTNGCQVHILGKMYVFYDVLGKTVRRRRTYHR